MKTLARSFVSLSCLSSVPPGGIQLKIRYKSWRFQRVSFQKKVMAKSSRWVWSDEDRWNWCENLFFSFSSLSVEVPRLPGREETLRISPWETVLHQTADQRLRRLSRFFVASALPFIGFFFYGTLFLVFATLLKPVTVYANSMEIFKNVANDFYFSFFFCYTHGQTLLLAVFPFPFL